MKYDRNYKPELCVSDDESREPLRFVEMAATRLLATDGTCLVSVPCVKEATDEDGAITADVLKAARKNAKTHKMADAELALSKTQATVGEVTMPRGQRSGQFPPWRQVVPAKAPPTISFNVKILAKIADAIGSTDGFVTLALGKEPEDPILVYLIEKINREFVVRDDHESDPFGVLMPHSAVKSKP